MSVEADDGSRIGRPVDSHVHPSRSDVDHTRLNGFAVGCLAHGDGAKSVHPLREGRGKTRGHVPHDEGGTERSGGKRGKMFRSAFGPPVEVRKATIAEAVAERVSQVPNKVDWGGFLEKTSVGGEFRDCAAARILAMRSCRIDRK